MSTILAQTTEASFPDRGQTGLRVTLAQGAGGRLLRVLVPSPSAAIHSRFAFRDIGVSGGELDLAGGLDGDGREGWSLRYQADSRILEVRVGGVAVASAAVPSIPDWSVIEVGIDPGVDPGQGAVQIYVNGRLLVDATADLSDVQTHYAWLGAANESNTVTGQYDLDEWIVGGNYIGPVRIDPNTSDLDDSVRWLVLYRSNSSDSAT